jgi:hypothetical protein
MICGGPKTGTSSLVALLNSHPKVLILFETDLNAVMPGKYARRLLAKFPDARGLMYEHDDDADAYRELQAFAAAKGHSYEVVGDKLPYYGERFFDRIGNFKVICSFREPDEWLAKACNLYGDSSDVRPVAFQYFKGLVRAHSHDDCLIVPFSRFLTENARLTSEIFAFVGLLPAPSEIPWWEATSKSSDPFKSCQHWWKGHPSSLAMPDSNDTKVVRKPHPFWDFLDKMMEPYQQSAPSSVSRTRARDDIEVFRQMLGGPALSLDAVMDTRTKVTSKKQRFWRKLISSVKAPDS